MIAIPEHFQKKKTELTNGSHYAHLARYLVAGDSLRSDTPIRVNALASGAITAKNESTPLPDKLVSLGYRITAADIGTRPKTEIRVK